MHALHVELSGIFRVFAAGQFKCAFTCCSRMHGRCCPIAMLQEVEKLQWATMWGADTMMDLRCAPAAKVPAKTFLSGCTVPLNALARLLCCPAIS
jgi:hypothetical protein